MPDTLSRRVFLGRIAYASGALTLSACKTIGGRSAGSSSSLQISEIDPYLPKRKNFNDLSDSDQRAFVEAIRSMHKLSLPVPANFGHGDQTDRELTFWRAQSESHQWFCDHGSWKFLPWHRAYLHVFELHLRKHIRDSFRLPYWDWSQNIDVPLALQSEELLRNLEINRDFHSLSDDPELFLNASQDILSIEDFDTIGGDESSSGMIEGPYHNMVHVYLGGHMGQIPTAAQDPVFWLHHCNVDRLWSLWMDKMIESGNIRQMFPSIDADTWLNLEYHENFWGPEGKLLNFTTRSSLFTDKLGYNYDTMKKTWDISDIPIDEPVAELYSPIEQVTPTVVSSPGTGGLNLKGGSKEALRIRFQLPLEIFQSLYPVRSLRLKCSGIPMPSDPSWSYKVFLEAGSQNLPLADLAFFPAGSSHHAHHAPSSIGITLNPHIDRLRQLLRVDSKVALILQPVAKDKSSQSLADTFGSLPTASSLAITVKAVYQSRKG